MAGAALVAAPYKDTVDWGAWRVFYADERCVALDHADSNHLALKTQLLDKLSPGAIPASQIFTIDPSGSPAEQAEAYEAALRKEVPSLVRERVYLIYARYSFSSKGGDRMFMSPFRYTFVKFFGV